MIKKVIKLGILGGIAFVFGSATFKLIGGIVALLAMAILVLLILGVKRLFRRNT
jgi:hypothetical protein